MSLKKVLLIFATLISLFIAGIYFKNFKKDEKVHQRIEKVSSGILLQSSLKSKDIKNFLTYIHLKGEPENIVLLMPCKSMKEDLKRKNSLIQVFEGHRFKSVLGKGFYSLEKRGIQDLFCDGSSEKSSIILSFLKEYFPNSKVLPVLVPSEISEKQIISLIKIINVSFPPNTIVIAISEFLKPLPEKAFLFYNLKSKRALLNFEEENLKNLKVDCWQCIYGARFFAKLKRKEIPKFINYPGSKKENIVCSSKKKQGQIQKSL